MWVGNTFVFIYFFFFLNPNQHFILFYEILSVQRITRPHFEHQTESMRSNCEVSSCRVVSVCTWSGSLELGIVGAVDRPSRDWSGRRSVSLPLCTRLMHSSVTAETFSCSISAGLENTQLSDLSVWSCWKQREKHVNCTSDLHVTLKQI